MPFYPGTFCIVLNEIIGVEIKVRADPIKYFSTIKGWSLRGYVLFNYAVSLHTGLSKVGSASRLIVENMPRIT
jgi:hypothetical protein